LTVKERQCAKNNRACARGRRKPMNSQLILYEVMFNMTTQVFNIFFI
jgi:hypothetical protein